MEIIKIFKKEGLEGEVHIVELRIGPSRAELHVTVKDEDGYLQFSWLGEDGEVKYITPSRVLEQAKELVKEAFEELDILKALTRI